MKKTLLYLRLAVSGIRKNHRLYVPYILACVGMVMMFYILNSLIYIPALEHMEGGANLRLILSLGRFVVAVFALLFLFYTNTFLIRRRSKEFGLYNVLGMNKSAICRVVRLESLIVMLIAMGGGMGFGIAFSKLAELGLVSFVQGEVDHTFTVSGECLLIALIVMGAIFLLLTMKSVLQVRFTKTMDLVRGANMGEKPPKANSLIALAGMLLLGTAYYLAVSIQSPLRAVVLFFVAVIMVIIGTYLLFIAGSVTLCRLLQRNKTYYYKKEHFVSVSSMAFRMKRNGAGLASICVLATMVLVMISSASGLYIGADGAIRSQYPYDICVSAQGGTRNDLRPENIARLRETVMAIPVQRNIEISRSAEFRYANIVGLRSDDGIDPDASTADNNFNLYDDLRNIFFMEITDYNTIMGTEYAVAPGEAMVGTIRCTYDRTELEMSGLRLNITGTVERNVDLMEATTSVIPSIFVLVDDFSELAPLEELRDYRGETMLWYNAFCGCDLNTDEKTVRNVCRELRETIPHAGFRIDLRVDSPIAERSDFYTSFGGLFFLGIILSMVFSAATVLIIYYKQISEGFEDRSRFEIMQKVGMSRRDIRRSINSQILTVFFAPLLMAGVHLIFAFPMVWKLLQLFGLSNMRMIVITTIGSFLVFGVLYAIVYKLTDGVYYNIVSGARSE